MTPAAKTVYYFGFYLLLLGLGLVFVPDLILTPFGFEATREVWIRVLGAVVVNLGVYYVFLAPTNNEAFFKMTAFTRLLIMLWFALFVVLDWAKPALLLFAAVDVAGALWTWNALRKG